MQLVTYFRETRNELKHVTWPDLTKVGVFSVLVIIFSIGMAYVLGLVDLAFIRGISEARTLVQGDTPSALPDDLQQQIQEQLKNNTAITIPSGTKLVPSETPAAPAESE